MKRRQNWWLLAGAAALLISLITVSAGAHICRWEVIVWLVLGINANIIGWLYSRMWARS